MKKLNLTHDQKKQRRTASRHLKDYNRRITQLSDSNLYDKHSDALFISKNFKNWINQIFTINMFKLKNKSFNKIITDIVAQVDRTKLHRGKNIQTITVHYNRCCTVTVDVILQTFKLNPDNEEYSFIAVIVEPTVKMNGRVYSEKDQYSQLVKLPPRKQYKKKVIKITPRNIDTLSFNMFADESWGQVLSFPVNVVFNESLTDYKVA